MQKKMRPSSERAKLLACLLFSSVMALGCARGGCASDALSSDPATFEGDPSLPGVKKGDRAMQERLSSALRKKGPSYKPRTHHLSADGSPKYTNRLILETSPYLLQHAHNPVNWFAWGPAAFERARLEGKPIFLSVGYATCHWCHVMEGESFEDAEIASFLNKHFISIKVDREERPDIDEIYLRAVRVLSGGGGWPMTVVMTPEKEPFFAGTYLPPRDGDRGAEKGLFSVLSDLSQRYQKDRDALLSEATETSRKIRAALRPEPPGDVPPIGAVDDAARALTARLDQEFGGLGRAPKFPVPTTLGFLLQHSARSDEKGGASLHAVKLTLDKMASGGLFDHLGGGFHRYATDARWRVPHFEKMLYDNAQLAELYLDAYQASAQDSYRDTARSVLDYLLSEMQSPEGGFFSASDADSAAPSGQVIEGHYFTWTQAEVAALLGAEEAEAVRAFYDVDAAGELEGRNVLHAPRNIEVVAESLGIDPMNLEQLLSGARAKLLLARDGRVAPDIDDKLVTGQNGLAISALARGSFVLGEPEYLSAARKAADYLLKKARDGEGRLLRVTRQGETKQLAFLDDYAFFIQGLLGLFIATKEPSYLKEAERLQKILDQQFWDQGDLGYFQTSTRHEEILAKEKPIYDGALPSGNSVTANNLLLLSSLLDAPKYREQAERVFRAFSRDLRRGTSAPHMLAALGTYHAVPLQVVLVLAPKDGADDPERQKMEDLVRGAYLPGAVVLVLEDEKAKDLALGLSIVAGKRAPKQTTAYVCEHGGCELPARDAEALRLQLKERIPLSFGRL